MEEHKTGRPCPSTQIEATSNCAGGGGRNKHPIGLETPSYRHDAWHPEERLPFPCKKRHF